MQTKEEFNKSISHIFDKNNEWIGYEYEVFLDQHHTRISTYNDSGQVVSVKHTFNNPPNAGSVQDFIEFMDRTKSNASNNNLSYFEDMKKKSLDLSSSIETAKLWREFQKR